MLNRPVHPELHLPVVPRLGSRRLSQSDGKLSTGGKRGKKQLRVNTRVGTSTRVLKQPQVTTRCEAIAEEIDDQRLPPDVINAEPGEALTQPGVRRRIRLRRYLIVADSLTAACFGALALHQGFTEESLMVLLWGVSMNVRLDRERRIGEFLHTEQLLRSFWWWMAISAVLGVFYLADSGRAQFAMLTVVGLYAGAYTSRRVARLPSVQEYFGFRLRESMLLVGDRDEVARTLREWEKVDDIEVAGICLPVHDNGPPVVEGHPVLGSARDIVSICQRFSVDAVALHDCGDLGGRQLSRLQWALEQSKTFVSLITPLVNTNVERVHARATGRRLVVDIAAVTPSGAVVVIRSILDRVVSTLLLVCGLPVMLVAALTIKIGSPGPVIFRQVRVRENNRTFVMYKLRTMTMGADAWRPDLEHLNEVGGGLFKMRCDPRVTRVGAWLRRFSIDELPQLVNVIKGEMALIGPRPALPTEVETYDDMARRRLAIKPGLTGLWQVSGRSNLSWEESVRLDMDYVDNWSPRRDVAIALNTLSAVLKRDGAF